MKKITAIGTAAAAALAAGMLPGCATSSPQPPTPSPSSTPATSSAAPAVSGEIWQWALGRNVWNDAALQPYTHNLGRSWDTDVNVQSQGFQLTPDSSGTVTSVTVYNDENALGYPGSDTNFSAYQGRLPLGLSWSDTATSVGQRYGTGTQSGGFGTDITCTYTTRNGYRVEIGFVARHAGDLPNSPIHYIRVSRA